MDKWTQMDKQMDGWTDRWTYRWMDGQMDKHTDKNPPVFYRTSFPWGLLPKNKNSHNFSHFWPFQALWRSMPEMSNFYCPIHYCPMTKMSNSVLIYKAMSNNNCPTRKCPTFIDFLFVRQMICIDICPILAINLTRRYL